ncbi:MAG TPA: hypothetical protein VNO52_17615 [Methylomirabilota bacterium]|nr:hypothetical protein [Methylomirabilota bacterium]
MRILWSLVALGLLVGSGCAGRRKDGPEPAASKPIITPGKATGRVAAVNGAGRFVVVTFPLGTLPTPDRRLHAFRDGLKVAELRPTEWQRDFNLVADIVTGDCQVGDDVREE